MEFNEKLSALLSLTCTKNISLAKAINIDTAQISRLKTGVRKMPHNPNLIQDISTYLASCIVNDSMIESLYMLTLDSRLHSNCDKTVLSEIIYNWFVTNDIDSPVNHVGQFLNNFSSFSTTSKIDYSKIDDSDLLAAMPVKYRFYHKNDGKRQAARNFREHLISLSNPCTIRVFSDESDDWIVEDEDYTQELTESIKQFTLKGCQVQRVQPQVQNLTNSLHNIERWLPCYMAGSLKMFYYPCIRDELHRCTIWVIPNEIVLYSISLYGMREPVFTIVSTETEIVKSFSFYFDQIIKRCIPMMRVYTNHENNKLTDSIIRVTNTMEDGIFKGSRLSPHTLPFSMLNDVHLRHSIDSQKIYNFIAKAESYRSLFFKEHSLTDIIYLANINNVLSGKEPIPGTMSIESKIYYTKDAYRMHLESIIRYLEIYPNYHVILMSSHELQNVVIYTKGNRNALLIKESEPFTLFDVIEPELASLLSSYLKNFIKEKAKYQSREEVIKLLKKEAARPELN